MAHTEPYTIAPDRCVAVARHCQGPRLMLSASTPPPDSPKTSVISVANLPNSSSRACKSARPSAVSRGTLDTRGSGVLDAATMQDPDLAHSGPARDPPRAILRPTSGGSELRAPGDSRNARQGPEVPVMGVRWRPGPASSRQAISGC